MKQLKIGTLPLPKVYIVNTPEDLALCKENGLPYFAWKGDEKLLIKLVMLPTLKKLLPHIKWEEHLGIIGQKKNPIVHVPGGHNEVSGYADGLRDSSDIATDYRSFHGEYEEQEIKKDLTAYIGDVSEQVNLQELQALNLLPVWADDIATNIRKNLTNAVWSEGYNKKHGVPIGNYDSDTPAENLIILDISGSIPRNISATMIALIDTLRSWCDADLIITASQSKYWSKNDPLPDAQWIRDNFNLANESVQFLKCLQEHVAGRTFSNVIVFGDNDCPGDRHGSYAIKYEEVRGTKVHAIWSYHTTAKKTCGYGLWAEMVSPDAEKHFNTDWRRTIKEDRYL